MPKLPPPGWMPDPSRTDIERYWDGHRWTSRTRDVVSKLERVPLPAPDAGGILRGNRGDRGMRPRRDTKRTGWWLGAAFLAASVGTAGYLGLLPAWSGWPQAWSVVTPAGPDVAYPVFGSDDLTLYLARSMVAQDPSIDVSFAGVGTADGEVEDALDEAVAQNPYVFVSGATFTRNGGVTTLEPDYIYDDAEADRRRAATSDAVTALVENSGAAAATSDAQAVTLLHDAIAASARYDWDAYASIAAGESTPAVEASQEAYGILVNRTAVCTGYAETLLLAAQLAGVPAVIVTGEVRDGVTSGNHAWNRVQVDGAWRVVDVTWDDASASDGTEVLRYDYLLLPLSDPLLASRATDDAWVVDANAGVYE